MDLEQESAKITVDTDQSKQLSELCNKMLDLEEQAKRLEENLKKKKKEISKLSELEIPNLMQQAGIMSLKLADGSSVDVKPIYGARIPQSKESDAFSWLTSNGHGDLIKNIVSLNFQRSQDNEANALVQDLINLSLIHI